MLLIQYLAERVGEVGLLVVGLYRDTDLDLDSPLALGFEELTRRRLARRMRLERLSREGLAEMLNG